MARFVGYERLVVQPDQVFGGEGLGTQFVTEVLDGVLAFECQLIGERQMHKRRFVIGITAFHLADKTLDDVRFLKFELQGTEYRVFQQIIERSLPVAGKVMSGKKVGTHSQVFPFAKGYLISKPMKIQTSVRG